VEKSKKKKMRKMKSKGEVFLKIKYLYFINFLTNSRVPIATLNLGGWSYHSLAVKLA